MNHRKGNAFVGLIAVAALVVIVLLGLVVWFFGCNNDPTPGGYVGYVTQGGYVSQHKFIGTQTGPTSTGMLWKGHVTNISVTPYTISEEFAGDKSVLSADYMQISFAVHVTFRIHPDKVKEFVEQYAAVQGDIAADKSDELVKDAYSNFIKERQRTYARDEIQKYEWRKLSSEIGQIGAAVQEKVIALTKNTPFEVQSVVVGNIQFPTSVATAVAEAQAATQILARKEQELKQAEAEAKKEIARAEGNAKAMELMQAKLTPLFVQYEAVQAQKANPTGTIIYIPVGNNGVPLVGEPVGPIIGEAKRPASAPAK